MTPNIATFESEHSLLLDIFSIREGLANLATTGAERAWIMRQADAEYQEALMLLKIEYGMPV